MKYREYRIRVPAHLVAGMPKSQIKKYILDAISSCGHGDHPDSENWRLADAFAGKGTVTRVNSIDSAIPITYRCGKCGEQGVL